MKKTLNRKKLKSIYSRYVVLLEDAVNLSPGCRKFRPFKFFSLKAQHTKPNDQV